MQTSSLDNTHASIESDINAIFLDVVNVFTPGSDPVIGTQKSEIDWGRSGNDIVLGFDPGANHPDQLQIDILIGDGSDTNFIEGDKTGDWSDRFILGDWKQPYYVDGNGLNFGLNQFALILDFNPKQDSIQLHGTSKDYQLIESPLGTAIFWQPERDALPDLITVLPAISHLSLEGNYFQFQGDSPPQGPVQGKIKQLGTSGVELTIYPATDGFGNVYVVGSTTGSLGGSNAGSGDVWFAKYDINGNQQWIRQFGSSNFDLPLEIATDKEGNSYLTGITKGDLGGANRESGNYQPWLAKYDSDGNQVWIQQFGTNLIDTSFGIDIDDKDNIYLSGFAIQEAPGIASFQDAPWVAKYDSNGNQQWYQTFGSPNLDENYGVAVSNDGSVYSTGWTLGDLGGNNAGLYDVWVAKHDNNGQEQWIKQFGTQDYEFSWGIDTDTQGNVYLTGWTLGDLGKKNAGSYDAWVAKYDSNGNQVWIQQLGTSGDDTSLSIKVDSNNCIYLTGFTHDNLGGSNAGSSDAWVAKYDSNGNQLWIQQFGTPDADAASGVTIDNAGHLYVTGSTEGSVGSINAGSFDVWIAKLDAANGNLQDFTGTPALVNENNTLVGNVGDRILTGGIGANADSAEGESIQSIALAELPTADALTPWPMGLTQAVAGAAEVPIGDDPLKDSLLTPGLDFSDKHFISPNHLF
jgi:hypothetical protein